MLRTFRWIIFVLVFEFVIPMCAAQVKCYPAGGVAGIVIATIVVTVVVMGLSLAAVWRIWKRKRFRKKPQDSRKPPSEKIPGDFAFDNPYFRDQEEDDIDGSGKGKSRTSMNNKNPLRSSKQSDLSIKGKKSRGSKGHHFIFGVGGGGKKQRALDDSCLAVEPERTVVALRGHDFTGLGFNICGNMRDGILVKDVLHRGPASESGRIKAGDRIVSVTVSFANIVYEDALTILSYASPYDVQLELERIPDKSRALQPSPAGSKRLGSCSFSSGGQKLFHPLYRSQSIDDLTQIDKDTFPSHGIGPRRSQSIGVAAHKLAAHFKHSDSRLEDKDRTVASVILSTTGSLNEKMLANVMADGALHKSGLQWEKRFEDTLESESSETIGTSGIGDSKRETPALTNKSLSIPKESISSVEDGRYESSDDASSHRCSRSSQGYRTGSTRVSGKKKETRSSLANSKHDSAQDNSAMKTTAQVHRFDDASGRRAKTMAEASNALWHLDQSIKDGDSGASVSDFDTSNSYPWNNVEDSRKLSKIKNGLASSTSSSEVQRETNAKKGRSQRREFDDDSDVSGDSLELGDKKRRSKKTKRRSSSLGDLTQLEETVKSASAGHDNKGAVLEAEMEKPIPSDNVRHQQKVQKKNAKVSENSNYKEQSNMTKTGYNNSWQNMDKVQEPDCANDRQTNRAPTSQYANSSVIHISNKEQMLERTIMNRVHSPKLSIQTSKMKSNNYSADPNENAYQKTDHYQPHAYMNSSSQQENLSSNKTLQKIIVNESPKLTKRIVNDIPSYTEKQELNNSRNFTQHYGSNNANSIVCESEENRSRFPSQNTKQSFQQRPPSTNYQKQTHHKNMHDEQEQRTVDAKNDASLYPQMIRKSANPAGMFTQINPFHQPSRQKNSAPSKPWMAKEESRKEFTIPVNGTDGHYSPAFAKSSQVTITDSSGRLRSRRDNAPESQTYAHRTPDVGHSKTVIISTFDNNGAQTPSSNFRQIRK